MTKALKLFLFLFTALNFFSSCENQNKNEYALEVYSPKVLIDSLSDKVNETSGLIFYRNGIWTLNDSGGEAQIYRLNIETGDIVQTISLIDVQNIDFESLTQDDDFIYVGDFGNNLGNRKDLSIYKIAKNDIPEKESDSVKVEHIQFKYANQYNFIVRPRLNNFDGEALFSYGDSLYIFTKNWVNLKTSVYAIPKMSGEYTVNVLYEFNADGLVTDASYNTENNVLSVLGYKDFMPFIWIFSDFAGNNFFSGNNRRLDLEAIHGAQTEGVCYNDNGDLLISCEKSYFTQSLFMIPDSLLKPKINTKVNRKKQEGIQLEANYIAEESIILLKIKGLEKESYTVEIVNEFWMPIRDSIFSAKDKQKQHIKLSAKNLNAGLYYIRVEQNERVKVSRVYLN